MSCKMGFYVVNPVVDVFRAPCTKMGIITYLSTISWGFITLEGISFSLFRYGMTFLTQLYKKHLSCVFEIHHFKQNNC